MSKMLVWSIVILLCCIFWWLSGKFADWLTPKLLKRIKLRQQRKKLKLNRCPMLECSDKGCFYYDKEHLICKFADNPLLLQEESDNV